MLELQRFFIKQPGMSRTNADYDILHRSTGQKAGEVTEIVVVGEGPS